MREVVSGAPRAGCCKWGIFFQPGGASSCVRRGGTILGVHANGAQRCRRVLDTPITHSTLYTIAYHIG